MVVATVHMKRGDTAPAFRARCLDGDTPVNLTGSTVRFIMEDASGVTTVDAAAAPDDQAAQPGWVQYAWSTGDTDTIGAYRAELEVTFPDGTIQTFPQDDYVRVYVLADLG